MNCPKCDEETAIKNGFVKGIQRYKCKKCGCQYTRSSPRGQPSKAKILAIFLYLYGLSMNMAGRIVGVSGQSVMRWVKASGMAFIQERQSVIKEEIEIDEMWRPAGKKKGFFEHGKYLAIPLQDGCVAENVAIVVRLPLKNLTALKKCALRKASVSPKCDPG